MNLHKWQSWKCELGWFLPRRSHKLYAKKTPRVQKRRGQSEAAVI